MAYEDTTNLENAIDFKLTTSFEEGFGKLLE